MVTLQEAKNHLRLEIDDDDSAVQLMIEAAAAHVSAYIEPEIAAAPPAPIKSAVLLLVADLYQNRERQQGGEQLYKNFTFEMLIQPYRSAAAP